MISSVSTGYQGSHRSGKSGKILKTFSSQENQGKAGFFSQNQGKNFKIREIFQQWMDRLKSSRN